MHFKYSLMLVDICLDMIASSHHSMKFLMILVSANVIAMTFVILC